MGIKERGKIVRRGGVKERGRGKRIYANLSYPFSYFVFVSLFLYLFIIAFVFLLLYLSLLLCFFSPSSSTPSSFFFIAFLSFLAFSHLNFLMSSSSSSTSSTFFLVCTTLVPHCFYLFTIPSHALLLLYLRCLHISSMHLTVYR